MSDHIIASSDGFVGSRKLHDALRANRELAERCAALEAKLSEMELALDAFWADRDIWDFDERGVPETWYPLGKLAEAFAKALAAAQEEA